MTTAKKFAAVEMRKAEAFVEADANPDPLRARIAELEAENVRLREALEGIGDARSAFEGGSIAECRRLARAAIAKEEG